MKTEPGSREALAQAKVWRWLTETRTAQRNRGVTSSRMWLWAQASLSEKEFSEALRRLRDEGKIACTNGTWWRRCTERRRSRKGKRG